MVLVAVHATRKVLVFAIVTAAILRPLVAAAHGELPSGDTVAMGGYALRALSWSDDPAIWMPLLASLAAYSLGFGRVWAAASARRRRAALGNAGWFAAGWVVLATALVSPLHALGEVLFSAHMVQHELLMVVAAPLLVLSRPLATLARAFPAPWLVERVAGMRRLRWPGAVWRCCRQPLVAWSIHAAALWLWHVPWLFEATLRSELVHTLQHVSFFGSALLFWWALLWHRAGSADYGAAVLYLFTTSVHSGALGALLTLAERALYPAYATTASAWGISAMEDQQLGGLIMWIPAGLIYAFAAMALLLAWIRDSERRATFARIGAIVLVVIAGGCSEPRRTGPTVYVSNERDGTISVIDAGTDRVVDVIRVGSRPRGIKLTPDNRRLCVALSRPTDGRPGHDRIACYDTETHRETAAYEVGSDPEDFSIGLDGRHLYVSNEDIGMASVVDTHGKTTTLSHQVGLEPEGVTTSPDGRWVYVTSEASSTVAVIDTSTDRIVRTFLVGARPRETAFLPSGRLAFVSAENGASVSVVDTEGHRVTETIDLPPDGERRMKPKGVVCSPDGERLYVATGRGNSVAVVDVASLAVVGEIRTGQRTWGIGLTPDGRKLYAANGLSNDVTVIDTASASVVTTIAGGDGPWGVAVRP